MLGCITICPPRIQYILSVRFAKISFLLLSPETFSSFFPFSLKHPRNDREFCEFFCRNTFLALQIFPKSVRELSTITSFSIPFFDSNFFFFTYFLMFLELNTSLLQCIFQFQCTFSVFC